MKKETKGKIIMILMWIVILGRNGYHLYENRYEIVAFDKHEARQILEKTWSPIETFNHDVIVDEVNDIILPPVYIQNRESLIAFFSTTMAEHAAVNYFDSFLEESEEYGLIVKKGAYFPTIYQESAYILNAHTRKKPKMEEEELVIEEAGSIALGLGYRRKNFYRMDEEGEWVHQGFSGNSGYFLNVEDNE
ncbi:hypothetical protein CACET_c15980 [Clostridium aceticum]|uniref:Uncharacterized protein n=1 Tax=Clostridium aceticum TaxID=84022 RepID=A0A0D8ID94_9CLOT|nr:hypothetical protein [Clostridium aceticum]AKL95047.1 hypothetical protein CACET_c15980 [Clostridium aceticum]KJF27937.1 hypothetical protein TZ02_05040 [Clostridium aceticum]